jgi:hypothetical protein
VTKEIFSMMRGAWPKHGFGDYAEVKFLFPFLFFFSKSIFKTLAKHLNRDFVAPSIRYFGGEKTKERKKN